MIFAPDAISSKANEVVIDPATSWFLGKNIRTVFAERQRSCWVGAAGSPASLLAGVFGGLQPADKDIKIIGL